MTKLLKAITGILFIIAVVNTGQQAYAFYKTFGPAFDTRDSVSHVDNLLASARKDLLAQNVRKMGYRFPAVVPWDQKSADLYWIQYALAPILVRRSDENTDDEFVMVSYSPEPRPFSAPGLVCSEDFGFGIALYKKSNMPLEPAATPDLGRVWHEREGDWTGTWTRRGLTDTFDAVWTGPGGQQAADEIRFESLDCGKVILFRKGAKGRYRGQLSKDGSRIENGTADFLSAEHSWSATIDK
jgi:hypothetical protein